MRFVNLECQSLPFRQQSWHAMDQRYNVESTRTTDGQESCLRDSHLKSIQFDDQEHQETSLQSY